MIRLKNWIKRNSVVLLQWVKSPYVLICLIDLVLSNLWEFWRDKRDITNPLYKHQEGWKDWFYMDLFGMYMRPMLMPVMFLTWYIKQVMPSKKHVWFITIYFILLMKDEADFKQNGNQASMLVDLFIFLVTIFLCEVIDQATQNRKDV